MSETYSVVWPRSGDEEHKVLAMITSCQHEIEPLA